MENNIPETIPYIVHEQEMSRMERIVKRLWILCIVALLTLVGTNAYWVWYENNHEDVITVTQETPSGHNSFINGDGDISINDPELK